ncbi:hypothetical protein GS429_00995 [Natronorubrum sp. JWXQ-INN-674]|uniref:Uncharacterized protein n=1 Tax=Natronorubrum halalkaliphilum TaxID=2691917 RepID=A0A6B0VHV0_9EURY|nr:hypothetical protein [Natronorubrum halalkaliphilum]MXV60667.1 hypothetical protein [Natronorubrum halalkaliphilum]
MQRRTTVTLMIALMVALAAVPFGAAGVLASEHEQETESDAGSVSPGEQLSGVIGVQEAEVNGELSERTYGIKIANAESDDERADVVDDQLADVEERLAELEQRLDELEDARNDGEITEGQYRAEVATAAAEKATVERNAEAAQTNADELDPELLEERGIDLEAIEDLRDRASELGGEEVAAIAQSIAGNAVGQSPAPDREPGAPIETGGPDRTDDSPEDRAGGPDSDRSDDADEHDDDSTADDGEHDDSESSENDTDTDTDTETDDHSND